MAPTSGVTEKAAACPHCTNALPTGRAVTFCPHCGLNVTMAQCPACSSEVDAGWHYCVSCGRDVSGLPNVPGAGVRKPTP